MEIKNVPNSQVGKPLFKFGYFLIGVLVSILLQPNYSETWLLIPIVLTGILVSWEYIGNQYAEALREEELHQQIESQLGLLERALTYPRGADVRCTFHIPKEIDGQKRLYQATNYQPGGGGKGRDFPIEKGIIGKSYTDLKTLTENFENSQVYREKMVDEYGYTHEEMGNRSADRRSYFCKPIITGSDEVKGLVYLDSDSPGTFPEDVERARSENDQNIQMIYHACSSIKDTYLSHETG